MLLHFCTFVFLITRAVKHRVLEWSGFCLVFSYFICGRLPVFMQIDWRAANNHVLCSWTKYSWADDMVQVAKNEMWASEVCFALWTVC